MRKAQKITIAVVAFVEAIVLFFWEAIDDFLYDWIEFWRQKYTPAVFMLFVLFLGLGIFALFGLKKKEE